MAAGRQCKEVMNLDWLMEEHGISYALEAGIVRVKVDGSLLEYLRGPGRHDALSLARTLRILYEGEFGRPLEIEEDSLAVEILVHAYLDVFFRNSGELMERISQTLLAPVIRFAEKMQGRTEVIDCGERAVDGNRAVFDALSHLHGMIYGLLGKYA